MWRIVYGVWDYIKNSGKFPESETLTLDWVGQLPGKRESRRFEGDYMLVQQDVADQRTHYDAVSYGGWSRQTLPGLSELWNFSKNCCDWGSSFQVLRPMILVTWFNLQR